MGIKGKPSLTVNQFCHWVNNDLPNKTLEPRFPRKILVETARKWMYELGFEVVTKKSGSLLGINVTCCGILKRVSETNGVPGFP